MYLKTIILYIILCGKHSLASRWRIGDLEKARLINYKKIVNPSLYTLLRHLKGHQSHIIVHI